MLAKDLSDKEIGRIIRFSGGSNFSNPDYEFRATYLGIRGYCVSVNIDLEFEGYTSDEIALKSIPDQVQEEHLDREIFINIDRVCARKKCSTDWEPVKSNHNWEAFDYNYPIEFEINDEE